MPKVVLKQLRFIGPGADQAAQAFTSANSGLIQLPWQATVGEFAPSLQAVVLINALDVAKLIGQSYAGWSGMLISWDNIDDLEPKIHKLMSRLVSGVDLPDPPPVVPPPPPKKNLAAKVGRETAGRRGKGVTTVFDLTISETEMHDLAQLLKTKCGTGGTVKEGKIEIQGDHRDKVVTELEKLGYKVKRSGG